MEDYSAFLTSDPYINAVEAIFCFLGDGGRN